MWIFDPKLGTFEQQVTRELQRRQLMLPLRMQLRNGGVELQSCEGGNVQPCEGGVEVEFRWLLYLWGYDGSISIRATDEQLRTLARVIGLVLPEPKEPTTVRVELHQVEQGRRRRRKRPEASPAAAGDADPEKEQIKRRMLDGR